MKIFLASCALLSGVLEHFFNYPAAQTHSPAPMVQWSMKALFPNVDGYAVVTDARSDTATDMRDGAVTSNRGLFEAGARPERDQCEAYMRQKRGDFEPFKQLSS